MDIFNKKRIEELEKKNAQLEHDLSDHMKRADRAEDALEELLELKDARPDDCTPGSYCKACEFVKEIRYNGHWTGPILTVYHCGKGISCKNFIQKKVEEK